MNTLTDTFAGVHSPLDRLTRALAQDLNLGKSKLETDFREAYPVLEQHLIQRMRKRAAMERFNAAYSHKLNQAQFRKLLSAERERRKETGDVVICTGCGRPLDDRDPTEQGETE
ncbi:hypothetical protein D7U98_09260 [Stenotrophomonas maltophilia]|uniref:hypothetical protein n=1 Tax=Stenotrophomonas TaxID=40323 RepID=UPI00066ADC78|nr:MULTISPECIES: hypothetical protein [Stenotrophomonas]MBA0395592.1 hypothetical protein [Stenotrophomonas maltophilia]